MSRRRAALRAVLRPPIVTRSLMVALVVGATLNLINQGDVMWAGRSPDWIKVSLTFVVPFLVASFGAWSALSSNRPGAD